MGVMNEPSKLCLFVDSHSSVKNSGNCILGMLCCVVDMASRVKRLSGGDHQRPVANAHSFCLILDRSTMSLAEGCGGLGFYFYKVEDVYDEEVHML